MIQLYISDKPVVVPESVSFTFMLENPYFTKNSNSSMNIELPLKDCPVNQRIFGHLHRLWSKKGKKVFPATLVDGITVFLRGSAIVNEITDTYVKVQLVSGNSEFNFLTNKDYYIDDIDLGSAEFPNYDIFLEWLSGIDEKNRFFGVVGSSDFVWAPVKCEDKIFNSVVWGFSDEEFHPNPYKNIKCVQPYLIYVIRKIVEYFGYKFDSSYLDDSFLSNVYICSAAQTLKIAYSLPHWTVSDFFDEIERFFLVVTVVDEINKTLSLIPLNDFYDDNNVVVIPSENVLQEYSVNITRKNDKDLSTSNVGFALPSISDNGFLRLDRDLFAEANKYYASSYEDMYNKWDSLKNSNIVKSYIFIDKNRFYIDYEKDDKRGLLEVNLYADLIRDDTNTDKTELKIVPAKIEKHNFGRYRHTNSAIFGDAPDADLYLNVPVVSMSVDLGRNEYINIQEILDGKSNIESKRPRKDIMEVAFCTGIHPVTVQGGQSYYDQHYIIPYTDYQQRVTGEFGTQKYYSLSLNNVYPRSLGYMFRNLVVTDTSVAYNIKFKVDIIPDAKKVFIIANQKYHCEKLEVKVDKDGFSNIVEGVFYRVE